MKLFDENGKHIGDIKDGVFNEKEMWSPQGGKYGISDRHTACRLYNIDAYNRFGIKYPTFKEAEEAGLERKNLALENQFLAEQNNKTGFVVDWGNRQQAKCYIAYDFASNKFRAICWYCSRFTGHVVSNKESAELLAEMLNEKRIEGYRYYD